MANDLSFLAGTGGASRSYTPDARKADGTLSTPTDTPRIEVMGPQFGTLADTATPDIGAANASFSLLSLAKGMVANLLAMKASLATIAAAALSTDPSLTLQAAQPSISVKRITGLGTTSVTVITDGVSSTVTPANATIGAVVSPADPVGRRSFRNTGNVMLEMVKPGQSYGSGHPLPPGESFTLDASGRVTGDIAFAAASAGGSMSILTF